MSDRMTAKDARRAFSYLVRRLGKHEAAEYNDVGGWRLEHDSGLWRVMEIQRSVYMIEGREQVGYGLRDVLRRGFKTAEFFQLCHSTVDLLREAGVDVDGNWRRPALEIEARHKSRAAEIIDEARRAEII